MHFLCLCAENVRLPAGVLACMCGCLPACVRACAAACHEAGLFEFPDFQKFK